MDPRSFHSRLAPPRKLVAMMFLCVFSGIGGSSVAVFAETTVRSAKVDETVTLEVTFGDEREAIKIKDIPWQKGMTVFDVMRAAAKREASFKFKHRGEGETLFVESIAGQANEGAGGKNWVFLVDDELGQRSCGVVPVSEGQRVKWRFGKYRPNE